MAVPVSESPLTVAWHSIVIGDGTVTLMLQRTALPSTLPSLISTVFPPLSYEPARLLPELSNVSTPSWSPIDASITVFHLPFTFAISSLPLLV